MFIASHFMLERPTFAQTGRQRIALLR